METYVLLNEKTKKFWNDLKSQWVDDVESAVHFADVDDAGLTAKTMPDVSVVVYHTETGGRAFYRVYHIVENDYQMRLRYEMAINHNSAWLKSKAERLLKSEDPETEFNAKYVQVAQVSINELEFRVEQARLEQVWYLTNNVSGAWEFNAGVTTVVEGPLRSTSIGDVVARGNKDYVAAAFGFIELDLTKEVAHV